MKLALAVLCISAVAFLLRVLAAFVEDWLKLSPLRTQPYFSGSILSPKCAELILLDPELYRGEISEGSDERIAS
jgi:hypothetical protein